jgi:hypothetical protein
MMPPGSSDGAGRRRRRPFEVQYSAHTGTEWKVRHDFYAAAGVVDIWLSAHHRSQWTRATAGQRRDLAWSDPGWVATGKLSGLHQKMLKHGVVQPGEDDDPVAVGLLDHGPTSACGQGAPSGPSSTPEEGTGAPLHLYAIAARPAWWTARPEMQTLPPCGRNVLRCSPWAVRPPCRHLPVSQRVEGPGWGRAPWRTSGQPRITVMRERGLLPAFMRSRIVRSRTVYITVRRQRVAVSGHRPGAWPSVTAPTDLGAAPRRVWCSCVLCCALAEHAETGQCRCAICVHHQRTAREATGVPAGDPDEGSAARERRTGRRPSQREDDRHQAFGAGST